MRLALPLLVTLLALFFAVPAHADGGAAPAAAPTAAELAPPAPPPAYAVVAMDPCCNPCDVKCARWHISIGAWIYGVDGTVGDNGREFDVDSDWTDTLDVLDSLEFAFDARLRVEWSKWRFTAGIDGSTLEDSVTFSDGVRGIAGEMSIWTAYAQLGYVIAGGRMGCTPCDPIWCLDVYAGARFWSVDAEFSAVAGGPPAVVAGDEWLDPLVGLHFALTGPKWFFMAEADIGGFGVGSDFAWSAMAAVGYRFSRGFATSIGWKILDVDREDGDFIFDAQLSGPFVSFTFSF